MVKIRLRRVGAKKQPSYRVVVADSRAPRDGRFIEIIGHYDPRQDPPQVVIYEDRALHWLKVGAQPSGPVAGFFAKLGLREKLSRVHGGEAIADVAAPRPKPRAEAAPDEAAQARPTRARQAKATVADATDEPPSDVAQAPEAEAEAVAPAPAEAIVEPVDAGEAPVVEAAAQAAPVTETAGAWPVADLGLSARVAKALEAEGINDTDQLLARLAAGTDALIAIPGIGAKAVDEIVEKLQERGLSAGA